MSTDDYALIVGINEYSDFEPLTGAERDALRFMDWLTRDGGVSPTKIIKILSSGFEANNRRPPYPNKWDIDEALKTLVPKKDQRKGRRLYFYFSGHGCAPSIAEAALLMADAARDMMGLSLAAHDYRDSLRTKAPFDEIVFF